MSRRKVQLDEGTAPKGGADGGAQQATNQLAQVDVGLDARGFHHQLAVGVAHLEVAALDVGGGVEDDRREAGKVRVAGVTKPKLAANLRRHDLGHQPAEPPIVQPQKHPEPDQRHRRHHLQYTTYQSLAERDDAHAGRPGPLAHEKKVTRSAVSAAPLPRRGDILAGLWPAS